MVEVPTLQRRRTRDDALQALGEIETTKLRNAAVHLNIGVRPTPSFADQLVLEVLVRGGAATLTVSGSDESTCIAFTQSAELHDVADRLICE